MLKHLRVKFICVFMAVVTVLLLVAFGMVLSFTRADLEAQSLQALRDIAAGLYAEYDRCMAEVDFTGAVAAFVMRAMGGGGVGAMIAGFVMATIPLLLMFTFSSRLYIEGITSGAVKA